MRVLGLFSGIGGFEYAFQKAGHEIIGVCEIEPFCQAVLRKHWPHVPIYSDVRTLGRSSLCVFPDIITGGFPCQDISVAGKGAGLSGERSGLWSEYLRIIRELRPAWVVIENVPALRTRGADRVLADLEAAGYSATPFVVGADDVGAPHRRKRVWIVAYANGVRELQPRGDESQVVSGSEILANPASERRNTARTSEPREADGRRAFGGARGPSWWAVEPDLGRVAHGVPLRLDRIKSLGNAIVPLIAEAIAEAIKEAERVGL